VIAWSKLFYDITNVVQAATLGGERFYRRLFVSWLDQLPERIACALTFEERHSNRLLGIMKHLLIPICLKYARERLYGTPNRSHDEADMMERAFGLPF
jgi:hypothetical protein